jgi:hypothetical protein
LSEPAGTFSHSENLVSNEAHFAHTVRRLGRRGGVYVGVGPEQNFSFITRVRPEMAFIIDIRRENRNLHLLYKALFEQSADRAEFVSRLFSRERPAGLGPGTTVQDLFAAYSAVPPATGVFHQTMQLVRDRLIDTHKFPLSSTDMEWITHVLEAFYTDGPEIHYGRALPRDAAGPSYRALMVSTDYSGESRSYLATEEGFAFLKARHERNLIVPVVGDFAGPFAIRRTGEYVREHHASVEAFYGSNVEVYLNRRMVARYCANLATLPVRLRTSFIDSKSTQLFRSKMKTCGAS